MAPTATGSASKPRGPIKSERNRAAAAGASSSFGPASSSSLAFHKKRAQGKSINAANNAVASGSNTTSRPHKRLPNEKEPKEQTPASSAVEASPPAEQNNNSDDDQDSDQDDEEEDDVRSKTALSLAGHPLPPLASLVDALSQFSYLQRLDLSSIEPSEAAPKGLDTLTWLAKAVFRSKASSKGKSRAFGDSLTWLNLSSNPNLTSEACLGLEALEELYVLTLSHCSLTSLPPSITPLRNLKALVLNNNAITSLPKSFPHLPELNSLILSHNELVSLPASMPASVPALKKVSLGHNRLKGSESLPDFSLCLALREVRLNDNPQLGGLPAHVRNWGKGADGKTAPGLELLELKDCGLETWESLSTLVEAEDERESQPRLRRKGLTQLLLKGNGVAEEEGYKERIVKAHPTLRVLDNERLQPRVKPADRDEGEQDDAVQKKGKGNKERVRSKQDKREVEADVSEDEEDDDAAAQMAADMRALRRGKSAAQPATDVDDDDDSDDDEAAQMAAEMRALRRGPAPPAQPKPNKGASKPGKQQKPPKSSSNKPLDAPIDDDDRSKPKHKRGSRAGKKTHKPSSSDKDPAKTTESTSQSRGFFETVDSVAEAARLAPIYELSKKRAKIASGRTEVAEGVLEDATSTLSKARQRESKGRTELDTFDDSTSGDAKTPGVKKKAKKEDKMEEKKVNTSVAGIVDLRKQAKGKQDWEGAKKRKADAKDDGGNKKSRPGLPFVATALQGGKKATTDSFGSGSDAWGAGGGAWD